MPHDKTRAAARKRMADTGEPYTAARRAAVSEHRAAASGGLPAGAGYALRMSDEIHNWLADLCGSGRPAGLRVGRALARLMTEGASLGDPLVVSTAGSWPWALSMALDRSYEQSLDRLTALRRGEADATALVKDIRDQLGELNAALAKLEEPPLRDGLDAGAGQPQEAAVQQAALQQQAAEARRLLPRMIEARNRLRERNQQLQARVDAARIRKESLKARYVAARGSIKVREAMAALDLADDDLDLADDGGPADGDLDLADDDGDQLPEDSGKAISAEEAGLADITAQMERELGQQAWPRGLMELWPGAPWHEDIRILFAVEPPGTALLIAVLEGREAVQERFPEAVMASADMLRLVRADQAPEAGAHAYDKAQSFVEEFYPGTGDFRG
jgi:hypothetical protein